jgi:hypothetical protein
LALRDRRDGAFGGLFACCLSSNIIAVAGPSTPESGQLICFLSVRMASVSTVPRISNIPE